ncbi:hypothetical protein AB901B6_00958 [Acinetobacter baumannii]|uniref:hypothetical protein n=1 Tax=Acinetobacter baumannii TaxID=470 RepID=UPI0013600D54|nr:hypothetical protein [Acinetobacter baumannii]CAA0182718.1 hypothetical protein AB901B6_00958 [Acinetobacter baumannii]
MATNWNAVLANVNNSADILAILRKVLSLLELKVDGTTIDEVLAQLEKVAADGQITIEEALETLTFLDQKIDERTSAFNEAIEAAAAAGAGENGWTDQLIVTSDGKTQKQWNDFNKNQFLLVESYLSGSTEYIDDALDEIKSELAAKGSMSGGTLMLPRGTWRISRSHDLSATGLRLCGDGGRYASRIIVDTNGDYSAGYVLKLAPTSGQTTTGGSGLEKITIDLNEAPAIGLIYQGAYDVSALDRAEVINGHKDYPCAIFEPTATGTVIQTLKIDTSGFSKKSFGGTGYVVEIRKAQECLLINSKMFGSPSNNVTKGSVPLLLEDVRGVQLIGGGYANSETNCIHIYAKTRNTTHVTIIGPTFEGYKAKAIKTWGDPSTADPAVTNKVSRLICMNERLISPSTGLLDASDLTFSTVYASQADVELKTGSTNNVIYTFDRSKVIDNGAYNEIIESPSSLNRNLHVSNRSQAVILTTTPQFVLGVEGRTGNYSVRWDASASVDSGMAFMTPNGSRPIRLLDDRVGFYGATPVTQRTSPAVGATDSQKIASIILGLEQLGLFKVAT